MKYIRSFMESQSDIIDPGHIIEFLLEHYNFNDWESFVDSQEMGQCQEITKLIEDNFGIKRMSGQIDYDEESENVIRHYWNEFNGKMYDFAKGTIRDYIDYGDQLYDVEVGEFWSLYTPQ